MRHLLLSLFVALAFFQHKEATGQCIFSADTQLHTVPISCWHQSDGSVQLPNPSSWGTPPFTVVVCDSTTPASCDSLPSGDYCYTVIDSNGDSRDYDFRIAFPPFLRGIPQVTPTTFLDPCNGEISVTGHGGVPPYSFIWEDGSSGTLRTGLCAGVYRYTITDATGCTESTQMSIEIRPDSIWDLNFLLEGRWEWIGCSGGWGCGDIITPTHTRSVIFSRRPNNMLFTQVYEDGFYVQSGNLLPAHQSTIFGPSWVLEGDPVDPVFGQVYVFPPPLGSFINIWAVTLYADELVLGQNVYDGLFYSYRRDTTFPTSCGYTLSVDVRNDSCNTGNGAAIVLPSGNYPPFNFTWNTNPIQQGDSVTGLAPGIYQVAAEDAAGCKDTVSVEILNIVVQDTTWVQIYDTVSVTVYDTSTVFIYDTTNIALVDTTHIQVYDTMNLTIYDTIHITAYDTIAVMDTLYLAIPTGLLPPNDFNTLKVYPNPTLGLLYIDYGNYSLLSGHQLNIINSLGQLLFNDPIVSPTFTVALDQFGGPGLYLLRVLDGNGQMVIEKKIVLQ